MSSSNGHASLKAAWDASFLAPLSSGLREQLLEGVHTTMVKAEGQLYEAYGPSRLLLIHAGVARVRATSRDGRAATIRYARQGQFIGLPSTVAGSAPVGAEAITDSIVSFLNPQQFRVVAAKSSELAWIVAQELARMSYESREFLGNSLFGTVEQRVARHLLELAHQTEDKRMLVSVAQNDLAASIGSVREVVARTLRRLTEAGLIQRVGRNIVINDPGGLDELASGGVN